MNKTPQLLINNGFVTDENGVLTEMVIPASVTTVQAPAKVTIYGDNIDYIPSTTAALQILELKGYPAFVKNQFKSYTSLNTLTLSKLTGLTDRYYSQTSENSVGCFNGLTSLVTLNAPELASIESVFSGRYNPGQGSGTFRGTGIVNLYLPKLTTITHNSDWNNGSSNGIFNGCVSLVTINLPMINAIGSNSDSGGSGNGAFGNCTSLTTVTLGSEGHPVSVISPLAFTNCTQSGLTITVYTVDGLAISGSPWGATNATIVWEEA